MLQILAQELMSDTALYVDRRSIIFEKVMKRVHMVDMGYRDKRGEVSHCWIYTGRDSGSGRGGGYPRMELNGETCAVHIVMWTNEFGYIPGKKQLDHLCRQRMCVRPSHNDLVTHKENQRRRDKAKKETANGNQENI